MDKEAADYFRFIVRIWSVIMDQH